MNLRSALRTLAFASVCALPLPAGVVTINFTETGGNVVVTLSGSLTDSTAWTQLFPSSGTSFIRPNASTPNQSGVQFGGSGDLYIPISSNSGAWTGVFGTGPESYPASPATGTPFGITSGGSLFLPTGYSFSTPTALNATMTFTGTFASLGVTPGTYSAFFNGTGGGDTITLTIGSGGGSSVPDAGPGPALALLLGGLGLRQWHSSRRSRAAA